MRVDRYFRVFRNNRYPHIDVKHEQEDLTEQVASFLQQKLTPAGLLVSMEARHLCMEMRGVARAGVTTRTTAVRGTFQDERLQEQFFAKLRDGASSNRRE